MSESCVILGGGGHAQVLIECLRLTGGIVPIAILDPNPAFVSRTILGVPVRGNDDLLPVLFKEGIRLFVAGVGGVGDNGPRKRVFEAAIRAGMKPVTVKHPTAVCSPSAIVGDGSVVLAQAVVNTGARIGSNVIINTGAIVDHHCEVRDHVHVAPRACLASTVKVEEEAHIGAGAVIRQGIVIGRAAVVGAGAVVVKPVAPGSCVVGVPAEPIRRLFRA